MAEAIDGKRLCLFIDGTWNTFENNTNVWRMYSLCADKDDEGKQQLVYYTKGIGTSVGAKVSGGLFGYGISQIIIDAYQWLVPRYSAGDEIFIFGFSRGAYAARSLSGLIVRSGIVRPGSPIGVGELYDRYKNTDAPTLEFLKTLDEEKLKAASILEHRMLKYCIPAAIKMIGVWDTVGALVRRYSFLKPGLKAPIENAYHCLAIDEHRKNFQPTLYTQNIHLDHPELDRAEIRDVSSVEQRWFVGAHANVGGGYNSDLLAQIPLRWLKKKAEHHRMKFLGELDPEDESCHATIRNSFQEMFHGIYAAAKFGRRYYRKIGNEDFVDSKVRRVTLNETIDRSVFERFQCGNYEPANLIKWAEAKGIKLEDFAEFFDSKNKIRCGVRVDNPSVFVNDDGVPFKPTALH